MAQSIRQSASGEIIEEEPLYTMLFTLYVNNAIYGQPVKIVNIPFTQTTTIYEFRLDPSVNLSNAYLQIYDDTRYKQGMASLNLLCVGTQAQFNKDSGSKILNIPLSNKTNIIDIRFNKRAMVR